MTTQARHPAIKSVAWTPAERPLLEFEIWCATDDGWKFKGFRRAASATIAVTTFCRETGWRRENVSACEKSA